MIESSTLQFLKNLKEHNNREWFNEHKKEYAIAKKNFFEITEYLIKGLTEFDKEIGVSNLDAKKCIMRINRDIRFSKDKSPYKTNFFTYINKDGKKSPFGGYYFSLDPEESFFGGGVYMPESAVLTKIRQEIDYNFKEWEEMVEKVTGSHFFDEIKPSGKLTRPPKGYQADHPGIQWIKFKGFYTQKILSEKEVLSPDLPVQILTGFREAKPLVDFVNRANE